MKFLSKLLKHWLTSRDGESYSFTKLIITVAASAMIYKFCESSTPDYLSFAGGISAMATALAAKYFVEEPEKTDKSDVNITGSAP